MLAAFFVALAVPDAYTDEAAWFAVAYFVVRVLQTALYVWGVRDDPGNRRAVMQARAVVPRRADRRARRRLRGRSGLTAPGSGLRRSSIDVVGTLFVARGEWRISPSHFAERYALIVIIALGESIVAIGIGTSELERDSTYRALGRRRVRRRRGAVVGVLRLHCRSPPSVRCAERRPRFAGPSPATSSRSSTTRSCSGSSSTPSRRRRRSSIRSTRSRTAGRWALGLGVAIFLCGFVLMRFRVIRRIAWERLAAAAVALVLAVGLDGTDAVVTLGVVIVVLVLSVAIETARLRAVRAEVRAG